MTRIVTQGMFKELAAVTTDVEKNNSAANLVVVVC